MGRRSVRGGGSHFVMLEGGGLGGGVSPTEWEGDGLGEGVSLHCVGRRVRRIIIKTYKIIKNYS